METKIMRLILTLILSFIATPMSKVYAKEVNLDLHRSSFTLLENSASQENEVNLLINRDESAVSETIARHAINGSVERVTGAYQDPQGRLEANTEANHLSSDESSLGLKMNAVENFAMYSTLTKVIDRIADESKEEMVVGISVQLASGVDVITETSSTEGISTGLSLSRTFP
jgi:hypothetical protein